jgi:hypothetical protein
LLFHKEIDERTCLLGVLHYEYGEVEVRSGFFSPEITVTIGTTFPLKKKPHVKPPGNNCH